MRIRILFKNYLILITWSINFTKNNTQNQFTIILLINMFG